MAFGSLERKAPWEPRSFTELGAGRSEPDRRLTEAVNSEFQTPNASAARSEPDRHLTEEILRILHKWGIHTLGQLAALDKEELRNRLGSEAVRLWERANGTATRLLKFVQPP